MIFTNNEYNAISTAGTLIITGQNTHLRLWDNRSFDAGGAINADGLIINDGANVDFCGNYSDTSNGGAIYSSANISFIDSSISFRNNYSISGWGGAIYQSSGELLFQAGTYEFLSNKTLNNYSPGSVIKGDKIRVSETYYKTTLKFINNSGGGDTIWVNSLDTSQACLSVSNEPGCSNTYKFYGNTSSSGGIIGFRDNLYMAGGYWDFSNNKISDTSNITTIYGYPLVIKKPTISIRYANISFDTTFITYSCSADVSNIGLRTKPPPTIHQKYYNYKLYNTLEFSGQAAIEISANRYPVKSSAVPDSTD